MKVGNNIYRFTYDAGGTPLTFSKNGVVYYYLTNLQGDVIEILDSSGNTVGAYTYDAWGVCEAQIFDTIEFYNPLRYRGYVYDEETGLYYLQSRYYNPNLGRFLNADSFTSTGQGFVGNNMFAYCNNNPVIRADSQGTRPVSVLEEEGCAVPVPSKSRPKQPEYRPYKSICGGSIDIYIVTDGTGKHLADELGKKGKIVVVGDYRNSENANMKIYYSYLITDSSTQKEILRTLVAYNRENPANNIWSRNVYEMQYEWNYHNVLASMGYAFEQTAHVDLDMDDKYKSVFVKGLEHVFDKQ